MTGIPFSRFSMITHMTHIFPAHLPFILYKMKKQDGNIHPSGPEARDIHMSASMITKDDGSLLIQALRAKGRRDPGFALKGRFVPITCRNTQSNSYCEPVSKSDQTFVSTLEYNGRVAVEEVEFDYMQGEFGYWMDSFSEWTSLIPSVFGGDAHCCESAGFEGNEISNSHAVLCLRGECDFLTKAEYVANIGAGMMIVSSHNNTLVRMGSDPPYKGRKLMVATAMVGSDAYNFIVDAYHEKLNAGSTSSIRIIRANQFWGACENQTAQDK